jgi:endonuclease YncB( thermonuclease family)
MTAKTEDLRLTPTTRLGNSVSILTFAPLLLALNGGSAAIAQERQEPAPACGASEIARGTVSRILDGRTFVLGDGREVRLAAVEVPPLPLPDETGAAPGAAAAKAALEALAGGDAVVLRRADAPSDRYGRVFAYAYVERDGDELFVQGDLIASGFARVGDRVGSRACGVELLRRESAAREAKLGLWADPYYQVLNAETPTDVLAHQGRFALVEGKVVSVRDSGSTTYLNFGRRWSEGFTVTISKRNQRNFAAAGLDVHGLAGRRVRVRGWIEERGGMGSSSGGGSTGGSPWIEADHPEQIETVDRD